MILFNHRKKYHNKQIKKMNQLTNYNNHLFYNSIHKINLYIKNSKMIPLLNLKTLIILLDHSHINLFSIPINLFVSFIIKLESPNFTDIIKDFYDVNNNNLPQDNIRSDDLLFDSRFESGNLFAAFKVFSFFNNLRYQIVNMILLCKWIKTQEEIISGFISL